jgi:pimeloyl-ACP methyl ester carboxylesterase
MSPTRGYAEVNGLKMYYEIHGSGEPLILLHGGAGATEMFGQLIPPLAETRQVIAADLDRPLSYELMADDVAALIDHLKFEDADVMGYSLGGGVAMRTAIQHPKKVRKLVLVSTPFKRNGWYPEVLAAMAQSSPESAEGMKGSPMYEVYSRIAPRVEDWPVLFAKLGALLRQDYDWSKDVAAMKTPTMLAFGDADSVRTAHAVEFFELLGGGKKDAGWDGSGMSSARLFILPGITHYNVFDAPALAAAVIPFLETPIAQS